MGNQWLKCLDFTPWHVWMVAESAKILLPVQFYNPEIISYSCYFPIYPFTKKGKKWHVSNQKKPWKLGQQAPSFESVLAYLETKA